MSSTLITNAHIYVERGRFAEALLVRNGFIRAVGTEAEVRAAAPADAKVFDAGGRTIVPGFIDSHQHLHNTGVALSSVQLQHATSIADVKRITREFIERRRPAPGTLLHGMGWNQDYFTDEARMLTRADLDEITTDYPLVFERACGHMLTANSAALARAGVSEDITAPESGSIGRDASGRLDGIFTENARAPLLALLRSHTVEENVELIRTAMRHAAECGVTSVHTCDLRPGSWRNMLAAYNRVMDDRPLVRIYHQANFHDPLQYREFLAEGCVTGRGNGMHRFGPLKLFVDGSLGARTALMREPYHDDPTTSGIATLTPEKLHELVVMANGHNCSIVTHAIGDGAIERVLDAYDSVCTTGMNPLRLGIVHVQITDRPLVERFLKNRILALVQPIFLHYDTKIVEERVGAELAGTSYAFGTMKRLGIHMSFGTDSPIEDMNPIDNLYCAVNRRRLTGEPEGGFHPEECLDIYDAVDAYTTEGAFASFEENIKGRLRPGFYADLVVLSEDIFSIDPLELRRTKIDRTMMGGEFVFIREGA
ncbi:amidohydrolase [Sutterella sp.]|uniref:amidohydrolase n=1 Tax=Sutterella sp. TaxID=1981025 RepID=UPI0026E10D99|nr:amidohydrolase [Sutterella sp.]MDO5530970.1 amidohydrolase [Sutterella sp.]